MTINPDISPDEVLSRYVLYSAHIRKNKTVKPDPFIPHPYPDLSVTRNISLTEDRIWEIGTEVASQCGRTLYGRAENLPIDYIDNDLEVISDPTPTNPNHANVNGWPDEKPAQKIVALVIAAKSNYIENL